MKKIFTLCVLLLPFLCFSQAPKKTNTILISTAETEDQAFKKIGRLLMTEGFTLETTDKDFYMLVTKIKTCKYGMGGMGSIDVKISVQIDKKEDKSIITLTGKYNTPDIAKYTPEQFDSKSMVIECCGPKSSMAGASWLLMENLAQKYEGGTIEYLTK